MVKSSLLRDTFDRVSPIFPGNVISTQVLRSERLLAPTTSSYIFTIRQGNNSSDGPLENLLNDSDAFVMIGISIGIKKQDTTVTPMQYGSFQLFTYPDPQTFVGAPAGKPKEFQALLSLYNGKFSFRTGSLERIRPIDTSGFLNVPQAQVVKQAAPAINDTLPQYGNGELENYGYKEFQPTMLLDGQQNNTFRLDLGTTDFTAIDGSWTSAGAQTATTRNVVVLRLYGLMIQNGSDAAKAFADSWKL